MGRLEKGPEPPGEPYKPWITPEWLAEVEERQDSIRARRPLSHFDEAMERVLRERWGIVPDAR